MRKTIFIILSLVATVTTLSAATPDFAYPQTVIADCEKRLSSLDGATGQKADISRAECLLDIVYARGLVDQQSYFNAPALVDSVARQITDPAVRALVRLIDADVYSSIYNASAYRYDQVKTPDRPCRPTSRSGTAASSVPSSTALSMRRSLSTASPAVSRSPTSRLSSPPMRQRAISIRPSTTLSPSRHRA